MLRKILDYISENKILQSGDKVVVGVSGGADSVCLLLVLSELMAEYELSLCAVHVHHGIRGEEADRDAEFVRRLCDDLKIGFELVKEDVPAIAKREGLSEEEAGRMVRYSAFRRIMAKKGFNKIAVAHNTNDSAETILHNLFRGSGIAGISGIAPISGELIRPLLCVSRSEIEAFLRERGMEYCTDSTNLEEDYMRNRIRNVLLPYVREQINAGAEEHIARTGVYLRQIKDYIDSETDKKMDAIVFKDGKALWAEDDFRNTHEAIASEMVQKILKKQSGRVKDFTGEHVCMVLKLFDKEVGRKADLPYGLSAERTYSGIEIGVNADEPWEAFDYNIEVPCEIELAKDDAVLKSVVWDCTNNGSRSIISVADGVIRFSDGNKTEIPKNSCNVWFDYDKMSHELSCRTRREKDEICLYKDGGSKKLKDYLIDLKIPAKDRDGLTLVAQGSKVLWIVGVRKSESCRIDTDTKQIIKFMIVRNNDGRQDQSNVQ